MNNSHEEDWADEKQKDIDLQLENQSLETELELQGGIHWKSETVDPSMENEFLKRVIAFEEADKEPEIPMRSLFPDDYEFPSVESMSPEELSRKLDDIARILSEYNIEFNFANELPDTILYKHIVEDVIPNETVNTTVSLGFTLHLDGCSGACDDCFQREYCSTAQELEDTV